MLEELIRRRTAQSLYKLMIGAEFTFSSTWERERAILTWMEAKFPRETEAYRQRLLMQSIFGEK